jgi:hypothetical protein
MGTLAAARSGSKYLLSAGRIRPMKRMHAPGGRLPKLNRVKLTAVFLRGLGKERCMFLHGTPGQVGFLLMTQV